MKKYRIAAVHEYGRYDTYEEASKAAISIQQVDPAVSIQYLEDGVWTAVNGPVEEDAQEGYPPIRSTGEHSAKIISRLANNMNRIGHPRPEDA